MSFTAVSIPHGETRITIDAFPEAVFTVGRLERGSQYIAVDAYGVEDRVMEIMPVFDINCKYRVRVVGTNLDYPTAVDAIEAFWPLDRPRFKREAQVA